MIIKDGTQITDLEDWRLRAGPKSAIQWKDGRSAKECAKAWLVAKGLIPTNIRQIVESHADFGSLLNWKAEPESPVRIDNFRGEPPNIDVLLTAEDESGPVVIVIEAKADETFGVRLEQTISKARKRLAVSPNSKGIERIERLTQSIFGSPLDSNQLSQLRYQLLTATGAALAEADRRGAERTVVLVHEFATDQTEAAKRAENAHDLQDFLSVLTGEISRNTQEALIGPISLPGTPISNHCPMVYFGKVVTTTHGGV